MGAKSMWAKRLCVEAMCVEAVWLAGRLRADVHGFQSIHDGADQGFRWCWGLQQGLVDLQLDPPVMPVAVACPQAFGQAVCCSPVRGVAAYPHVRKCGRKVALQGVANGFLQWPAGVV